MARFTRVILLFLILGGIAFGIGSLLRDKKRAEQTKIIAADGQTVPVTVAQVVARPIQREIRVVGTLYGRAEVNITPKVEGRILKIHKDLSDRVKPGDLLLELDATDYRLAAAEAKRSIELELARVGLKSLPQPGEFKVNEVPTVLRAMAQEKNAIARRERVMKVSSGASTADERDAAQAEYEVARANYQLAVLEAEAALASARFRMATLEMLEQRIKDTRIVAPTPSVPEGESAEYVVAKRGVAEGEMVRVMPGDNTVLFRLIIRNPLKVIATIPEKFLSEIRIQQDALLEVESYPGRKFTGKVSRISPAVDRASRTFQVEILIPNPQNELYPGSFAKISIQTRTDPNALTVPEEAVVSFAGVTKVLVVRDNQIHEVLVQLGEGIEERVGTKRRMWLEVLGNLQPGDTLVTSGQSQLAEGSRIRVREASPESTPGAGK